jgi:predicted metal-dependent hydrolase
MMRGSVEYGSETIAYEICFAPLRQTLGIEVHPDQSVVVKAPLGCSADDVALRVRKRAAWISRQIAEFERYKPRTPNRQYLSGETHLYLGRQYRLKVMAGEIAAVVMRRGQLEVSTPGCPDLPVVKRLLQRWYLDRARAIFAEVLEQCLVDFKASTHPRLTVREMQSRWGSLSHAGTLTLNARLIQAPRACIEYVIAHELCHLKHRDHDAHFYRHLTRLMPDWEKRKRRLEVALL